MSEYNLVNKWTSYVTYKADSAAKTRIREKEGVVYLSFPSLEQFEEISHGFSTKIGGVSEGCLESMNLSFFRGDDPEKVKENYRRICHALDIEPERLVFSDQVHDTVIKCVTEEDCAGTDLGQKKLQGIDGLITNVPHVALCTSYADCVPLYFVDPVKKVIALSHAGWRGTVGKIGEKTVQTMTEIYDCNIKDIQVQVGPSICADCYEIGETVAQQFKAILNVEEQRQVLISMGWSETDKEEKYHLDLWKANKIILEKAGIPKDNIALPDLCTCCNHELLFSHRYTKGKRGNLNAFLMLK